MSDNSPFLVVDQSCNNAVVWLTKHFSNAGLFVMRTFDLQVARHIQKVCPCPHHNTEKCDCQMVVLLVYQDDQTPITIIAHGYNNQTRFLIVDNPQQRANPHLEALIRRIIILPMLPSANLDTKAHII
jgi:hypothetical protein